MAEHSIKCPMCDSTITAESEAALVKQLQQHAKEHHDHEMSEQEAKDMIES